MIKDDDGAWIDDEDQIKNHLSAFYQNLFLEPNYNYQDQGHSYKFQAIDSAMAQRLGQEVTKDEIDNAMFCMKPWKAPGSGGFQARFYQTNWNLVAPETYDFVKKMWRTHDLIGGVNAMDICLIPKVPKAEFVNQFRLISLCNLI